MSSWGNNDNAANTPLWACHSVNVSANTNNQTLLFANTTLNAWNVATTGGGYRHGDEAIGVFGIDANESQVRHGMHTGWVLRTQFTGGRAGRIQEEVLVALSTMNSDSDTTYANTILTITTQPSSNSAVHGNGNTVTFSVGASSSQGFPITYYWQFNNGLTWANTSSNTVFSGNTSTTLTANAATVLANTWKVRVVTNSLDQTVTSANATITIY